MEKKEESHSPYRLIGPKLLICSNLSCLTYLFSLPLVIWAFHAYVNMNYNYHALLVNWSTPIITDMFIPNGTACPTKYNYVIPYAWGGNNFGCDCANTDASIKTANGWLDLMVGNCTSDQLSHSCFQVAQMESQQLPFWFNSTLWCADRSFNDTFITRAQLVQADGSCYPGTLKCGDTTDVNKVFCTTSAKCPITSLVVSKAPPNNNYLESLPFPTNQGSGYNLYISRNEPGHLPIVEFKVTEGNVCLDPDLNNLSPNQSEYLLATNPRVACSSTDPRYTVLDSQSEMQYFLYNGFNLSAILPNYMLSSTVQYNLDYRSIIDFKVSCRSMFIILAGTSLFIDQANNDINNAFSSLICGFSCYIFIHVILCLLYSGRKSQGLEVWYLPLLSIIVCLCIRVATIGVCGRGYQQSTEFDQAFEYVNGRNCSDDITNSYFDTLYFDFYTEVVMVFLSQICYHAILFSFELTILICFLISARKMVPKEVISQNALANPIPENRSFSGSTDRSHKPMKHEDEIPPPHENVDRVNKSLDPNFEFCDIEIISMEASSRPQPNEESAHQLGSYLKQKQQRESQNLNKPKSTKGRFNEDL